MENTEQQKAWKEEERIDRLHLKNKEIEPVENADALIRRNLQLGNVAKNDFQYIIHNIELAVAFEAIPTEHGGFLTHTLSTKMIHRRIDRIIVASNSVDGFLRKNLNTERAIQKFTQTTERKGFNLKRKDEEM